MLHCKVASLSWSQPSHQNLYEATQKKKIFLFLLPPHPLICSDSELSGCTSRPSGLRRQGYRRHQLPEPPVCAQGPGAHPSLHTAAPLVTAQSVRYAMDDIAFSIPKVTGNCPSPPWDGGISKGHTVSKFPGAVGDGNCVVLWAAYSCWNIRQKFEANPSGLNSAPN